MLDLFNDANIYQTWSYGVVRWGAKNLSHMVLKRDGEVLGMAQLRIIRPTRLKFGMAYLRWGPLCERRGKPLDPEVLAIMSRALEEEYVEKRRLLLRVLPNAFAGSPRAEPIQAAFSRFTPEALTSKNTYGHLYLISLLRLRNCAGTSTRNGEISSRARKERPQGHSWKRPRGIPHFLPDLLPDAKAQEDSKPRWTLRSSRGFKKTCRSPIACGS